jgi:hypothetical protein
MDNKIKEFKPTSWAIDNKTSIYVLVLILIIFGLTSYQQVTQGAVSRDCDPYNYCEYHLSGHFASGY